MNTTASSRQSGFTVIELVVVATVFALAGFLIFLQVNKLNIASQDSVRKTAINAMYYALEEVYYKEHSSYPATLTSATLPSVDPDLFTDPDGFTLGKDILTKDELQKLLDKGDASTDVQKRLNALNAGKSPNYHYTATNCDTQGSCKSYTLRADLQSEAEYVKKSRSH
ncbi:MAG: type II secretion system protein [Candidatus Nomurabacteria bacterium]|nr:MAG: type II secretion system protein [Candidatus Nomurabacteria bacterium]